MRHVREILRLSLEAGLSTRVVGERIGVGSTTVRDTLKRFTCAKLTWPVPPAISDTELEQRLYGVPGVKPGRRKLPEPDWSVVAREMKRKHVTLQFLWDEYIAEHADGYRYSRFCDLFRGWEGRLPLTMRQSHGGGEKLFIDYAGDKVPVVDRQTGEVRDAHIFVAVMGGSSLSFGHATWTEQMEAEAREALTRLDPLWDELFPAEQARIVALLVERIDIGPEDMNVRLRVDGLSGLAREMQNRDMERAA